MNPIEILNRIQEKEKEKDKPKEKNVMVDKEFPTMEWKPMEASTYTVSSFYPPTLTKPNIKKIQKVMAFVDMVKYKRVKEGTTVMPIPTTNKQMIRLCGNQREVTRLIGFMVDICPFLFTLQVGAVIFLSASNDFSAFASCTSSIMALNTTMAIIIIESI